MLARRSSHMRSRSDLPSTKCWVSCVSSTPGRLSFTLLRTFSSVSRRPRRRRLASLMGAPDMGTN
eukprot:6110856-Heterocapsa_arctica.AAC.1